MRRYRERGSRFGSGKLRDFDHSLVHCCYGSSLSDIPNMEMGPVNLEVVVVVCSNGHQMKIQASRRIPEEERLAFCPICFVSVVAPLTNHESKRVNW